MFELTSPAGPRTMPHIDATSESTTTSTPDSAISMSVKDMQLGWGFSTDEPTVEGL